MPALALVGVFALLLQSTPEASFDDLARRASEAVGVNPTEALHLFQQALAIRPDWAEGWLYSGASLYELGRFAESRDALRKGVELAPTKGTGWAFLGLAEYGLGDYDHALDHIRKSEALGIADNPAFVGVVRHRAALIYLRHSDFKRAVEQLRPLATLGAETPDVIDALGAGVLGMTDLPDKMPPEKHEVIALAGRAAWAFYAQRPDDANAAFHKLTEAYPSEPGVHYASGIFFLDRDPEAALNEFRKEIEIRPDHVSARLQIVFLEIKAGDSKAAIDSAREAVKLEPANFLCHVALGRALLTADQPAQAIPELEAAVKMAAENPQAHFYLEQAYRRAGRDAEAKKEKTEFTRLRAAQDPLNIPFTDAAH